MSDDVSPGRESQPNASGPEGLAGDMGISSERADDLEGIEGTGSAASTQGRTDGEAPPLQDPPATAGSGDEVPDKPDETSPVTHVDRTVGEVQPDEVTRKHEFDPGSNPGH